MEAELQDVYSLMNSSINIANNCVVLPDDGFDAAIAAVTIATADTFVDTLVSLSPLGKRKGKSPQDSSQLSREIHDAKWTAISTAVVQKQNEEVVPIDLTSPSGGKSSGDYTQPYIRWLELIMSVTILLNWKKCCMQRLIQCSQLSTVPTTRTFLMTQTGHHAS
jgi:hypothetical protein